MPERKHMLNPNDHEAFVGRPAVLPSDAAIERQAENARRLPARAYENSSDNNVRLTLDRQVESQPSARRV